MQSSFKASVCTFMSPYILKSQITAEHTYCHQCCTNQQTWIQPPATALITACSNGLNSHAQGLWPGGNGMRSFPGCISSQTPTNFKIGPWTSEHNMEYHWGWQVCPHTMVLFQYQQGQWMAHQLHIQDHTCITYRLWASPTSTPANMVPATPLVLSDKIRLQ